MCSHWKKYLILPSGNPIKPGSLKACSCKVAFKSLLSLAIFGSYRGIILPRVSEKMYKAILIALKTLVWCWRRYSVHNGYPCTPSQRKEAQLEPKWATVQATCIHLSAAGTVALSSNISEDTAADSAHIYRAAETSDCWRNCAESICRQHTQGVQSAAYSNTETLFIGPHMPPLSHT